MDIRMCLWCVYSCRGMNPIKGGVQCERISQTPFDSLEQLYLNKATILRENPSNLLIPISVFGLRDSSIVLICFCLSEAAEGFQTGWHLERYRRVTWFVLIGWQTSLRAGTHSNSSFCKVCRKVVHTVEWNRGKANECLKWHWRWSQPGNFVTVTQRLHYPKQCSVTFGAY